MHHELNAQSNLHQTQKLSRPSAVWDGETVFHNINAMITLRQGSMKKKKTQLHPRHNESSSNKRHALIG